MEKSDYQRESERIILDRSNKQSVCFRLYVGECTIPELCKALIVFGVESATVSSATGVWQGLTESTAIAELIVKQSDRFDVDTLAHKLAVYFRQDCVLVTRTILADSKLVTRS